MFLDPRLEADSAYITDLKLSQVRLSHNGAFPWIILIPQQEGLVELIDLNPSDQRLLMQEIGHVSHILKEIFQPTKLNVAALGNAVSQLHIHVVARYNTDEAWPHVIWNSGVKNEYDPVIQQERIHQIKEALEKVPFPSLDSPLKQAHDLFLEAACDGFDWESAFQALAKVQEETEEVLAELKKPESPSRQRALEDELGDLFFACVVLSRHCRVDPEEAVSNGVQKFRKRYARFKAYAAEKGLSLKATPRSELAALWQELKKKR